MSITSGINFDTNEQCCVSSIIPKEMNAFTRPSQFNVDALKDSSHLDERWQQLSRSGLNKDRSSVSRFDSRMEFHLEYESHKAEYLTADGYYSSERQELSLSLNFAWEEQHIVDGRIETRSFEFNLSLKAESVKTTSVQPFQKKEDIMHFVRRLLNDLRKIHQSDDKKLAGVHLDHEDFKELSAIDNGRLLKEVMAMVQMMIMHAQLKDAMEKEEKSPITLYPEREKFEGVIEESKEMSLSDFQLEYREIKAEYLNQERSSLLNGPNKTTMPVEDNRPPMMEKGIPSVLAA